MMLWPARSKSYLRALLYRVTLWVSYGGQSAQLREHCSTTVSPAIWIYRLPLYFPSQSVSLWLKWLPGALESTGTNTALKDRTGPTRLSFFISNLMSSFLRATTLERYTFFRFQVDL